MTYLLAFLAGLFGLGIIRGLARPRHYDPNREFYDADTGDSADTNCGGCGDGGGYDAGNE